MQKKNSSINPNYDELFDKEFDETDFGSIENKPKPIPIKASERRGRPKLGRKFNVVMPDDLILKIQEAGKKRGIGYQTMVRLICSEQITRYLDNKDHQE